MNLIYPDFIRALKPSIYSESFFDSLMKILSLDLGTKTGWALSRSRHVIESGSINLKPPRGAAHGWRYHQFHNFLTITKNRVNGLDLVAYEQVTFMGANGFKAVQLWGGFEAVLTSWAEYHEIAYDAVHVATWKKSTIGNGHAGKEQIMAAMKSRGFNPKTQDEADAIGVLLYFLERNAIHKSYIRKR